MAGVPSSLLWESPCFSGEGARQKSSFPDCWRHTSKDGRKGYENLSAEF